MGENIVLAENSYYLMDILVAFSLIGLLLGCN